MRIGLLMCDHVAERLRSQHGDYDTMFERLLARSPSVERAVYEAVRGEVPEQPDECDGWIITGSRYSAYDDEAWIHRLTGFVRAVAAARPPLVGICFGHQIIGHALGGEVRRSPRGWGVGVSEVHVGRQVEWMVPAADSYRALAMHGDQVEVPPPGALILAGNDHCPVGMMTVGDNVLGIQAHPEFTAAYDRELMEGRRDTLIPGDVVDAGLATLGQPTDSCLLATWIVRFLAR